MSANSRTNIGLCTKIPVCLVVKHYRVFVNVFSNLYHRRNSSSSKRRALSIKKSNCGTTHPCTRSSTVIKFVWRAHYSLCLARIKLHVCALSSGDTLKVVIVSTPCSLTRSSPAGSFWSVPSRSLRRQINPDGYASFAKHPAARWPCDYVIGLLSLLART